jgi:hypothetical protein
MTLARGLLVASIALAPCAGLAAASPETPSALDRQPGGWTDLLARAGPKLEGWTRLPIPPGGKLRSTTDSQWSLDPATGHLVCRGDGGHEWLRWDQPLGDGVFHVEWRFTPVEGKKGYNSGIYARNSADASVWIQAQTGDASGGHLFGSAPVKGKTARFNASRKGEPSRVKPAGEWNTFELTSRGKQVSLWVNGAETSVLSDCDQTRGYVGLEAEGWRIEFRNVKLRPLGD